MRILILDDDKSYGSLMASATKKLGHQGLLCLTAEEAVAAIEAGDVDAVLVDIDMPELDGFAFAKLLSDRDLSLPLAYCVGTCFDDERIRQAENQAPVLPKIWTHADLKTVITQLRKQQRHGAQAFARGTPTPPQPVAKLPERDKVPSLTEAAARSAQVRQPLAKGTGAIPAQRRSRSTLSPELASALAQIERDTPRIRIRCQTWRQVRSLCNDVSRGITSITVRTREAVDVGHDVIVALALPDEMVVSIPGRVVAVRDTEADGKTPSQIELVGLGQEQLDYLMSRNDSEPSSRE